MERYFMVVKPKREIPKRNFQGFLLRKCMYEEEVMDIVYRPTGYPRRTERKMIPPPNVQSFVLSAC
jgi:hypothetical protein